MEIFDVESYLAHHELPGQSGRAAGWIEPECWHVGSGTTDGEGGMMDPSFATVA